MLGKCTPSLFVEETRAVFTLSKTLSCLTAHTDFPIWVENIAQPLRDQRRTRQLDSPAMWEVGGWQFSFAESRSKQLVAAMFAQIETTFSTFSIDRSVFSPSRSWDKNIGFESGLGDQRRVNVYLNKSEGYAIVMVCNFRRVWAIASASPIPTRFVYAYSFREREHCWAIGSRNAVFSPEPNSLSWIVLCCRGHPLIACLEFVEFRRTGKLDFSVFCLCKAEAFMCRENNELEPICKQGNVT